MRLNRRPTAPQAVGAASPWGLSGAIAALLCFVAVPAPAQQSPATGPLGRAPQELVPFLDGMRDGLIANFIVENCADISLNSAEDAKLAKALRAFLDVKDISPEQVQPLLEGAPDALFIEYWLKHGFSPEEVILDNDSTTLCAHGRDISTATTSVGRLLIVE